MSGGDDDAKKAEGEIAVNVRSQHLSPTCLTTTAFPCAFTASSLPFRVLLLPFRVLCTASSLPFRVLVTALPCAVHCLFTA